MRSLSYSYRLALYRHFNKRKEHYIVLNTCAVLFVQLCATNLIIKNYVGGIFSWTRLRIISLRKNSPRKHESGSLYGSDRNPRAGPGPWQTSTPSRFSSHRCVRTVPCVGTYITNCGRFPEMLINEIFRTCPSKFSFNYSWNPTWYTCASTLLKVLLVIPPPPQINSWTLETNSKLRVKTHMLTNIVRKGLNWFDCEYSFHIFHKYITYKYSLKILYTYKIILNYFWTCFMLHIILPVKHTPGWELCLLNSPTIFLCHLSTVPGLCFSFNLNWF
jgi:hypothetical protein